MNQLSPYDAPRTIKQITALPALALAPPPPGAPSAPAREVIGIAGRFTDFEIVINAPREWLDVTFDVMVTLGACVYKIAQVALADLPLLTMSEYQLGADPPATKGNVCARLFAIRGIRCDNIQIRAYQTTEDHAEAEFAMRAWGSDGFYSDRSSQATVQPFGSPTQQVTGLLSLDLADVATEFQLLPSNPTGGRVSLPELIVTTDDTTPRSLAVRSRDPEGTNTVLYSFFVSNVQPFMVYATMPKRGRPLGNINVTLNGASVGAQFLINATGINE